MSGAHRERRGRDGDGCPVCGGLEALRQHGGIILVAASRGYDGWSIGVRTASKPRPRWTATRPTLAEAVEEGLALASGQAAANESRKGS